MHSWTATSCRYLMTLAFACTYGAGIAPAVALSPSGETLAVVQATTASGPGGTRTLARAKPIFSGDRIVTGGSGEAQIRFADNTRLVVGANSSIVIDKFLFNPDRSVAGVAMTMTRGAFRFMSGKGPKKAYQLTTPYATLGIRGTRFDVAVDKQLGTAVAVFDGAVRLCNRRSGTCTTVNRGCGVAIASPGGSLSAPASRAAKASLIRSAFPLIARQKSLRSDFRVSTAGCTSLGTIPAPPPSRGVRGASLGPGSVALPPGGGRGGGGNGGGGPGAGGGGGPPGGGPPGNPGTNPGASGNTPGGGNSGNSNASSTATSNPGNSGNSNAGGSKK
jgi:hypothetical protein